MMLLITLTMQLVLDEIEDVYEALQAEPARAK